MLRHLSPLGWARHHLIVVVLLLGRLWKACQPKERGAVIEDIDYRGRGGLDRAQLASLASCDWIRQSQNLLIHGATGSGKTYLACALAHQACRAGLSAWYVRAPRLFEELSLCHADGTFRKRLAAIAKIQLVIVDDFAISPIGPRERNDLLELLDDRVGSRASILTSQLPLGRVCLIRASVQDRTWEARFTHRACCDPSVASD